MEYVTVIEPSFINNSGNYSQLTLATKMSKFDFVISTEESIMKKSKFSKFSKHSYTKSQPEILTQNCTNTLQRFFKPEIEIVKSLDLDSNLKQYKPKSQLQNNIQIFEEKLKAERKSKEKSEEQDGKSKYFIQNYQLLMKY